MLLDRADCDRTECTQLRAPCQGQPTPFVVTPQGVSARVRSPVRPVRDSRIGFVSHHGSPTDYRTYVVRLSYKSHHAFVKVVPQKSADWSLLGRRTANGQRQRVFPPAADSHPFHHAERAERMPGQIIELVGRHKPPFSGGRIQMGRRLKHLATHSFSDSHVLFLFTEEWARDNCGGGDESSNRLRRSPTNSSERLPWRKEHSYGQREEARKGNASGPRVRDRDSHGFDLPIKQSHVRQSKTHQHIVRRS